MRFSKVLKNSSPSRRASAASMHTEQPEYAGIRFDDMDSHAKLSIWCCGRSEASSNELSSKSSPETSSRGSGRRHDLPSRLPRKDCPCIAGAAETGAMRSKLKLLERSISVAMFSLPLYLRIMPP